MSKRIYAAIVGAAAAVALSAPAEARIDNGPISSLYENDGHRSITEPKRARENRASARRGSGKSARLRSGNRRVVSSGGRKSRLASRAVTADHAGGGASRSCLQAPARSLLDKIEQQFGPVNVISTCRPGAVIAGSGKPSKHRYGLAVDFDAGGRKGAIVNWLRANHHSGGTMTYANMSHIHVDIGPHFVQLGAGGRRRG
jgi:hypothetical protein